MMTFKEYEKTRKEEDKEFIFKMTEKMSELLYKEIIIGHLPDPNEKFNGILTK